MHKSHILKYTLIYISIYIKLKVILKNTVVSLYVFFLCVVVVGKFKKADIFPTCVSKQMNNKNVARKSRDFSAGFTDSSLE